MTKAEPDAPYLIIIRSGPSWNTRGLRFLAENFGTRFRGEIYTYGHEPGHVEANGIEVHQLVMKGQKLLIPRFIYMSRIVGRAFKKRWLSRQKFTVIAYDPFQSGLIGLAIKWLTGARFVCEVNGAYGDDDNYVDLEDPDKRRKKKARMLRVGSFVLGRADVIKLLFPDQLRGFAEVTAPRVCFHNLVDETHYQPAGIPATHRLAFVGHPFYRKGGDILLQAWARLHPEFPDWSLSMIGFRLEEDARAAGLPTDGVEFPGPQPRSEVSRMVESSAGLVVPSRSEAMARVQVEAAHLGRPRIVSRRGGLPHYVEHGVDGLVFDLDVDSLVEALRTFMSDPELRERLGRNALAKARESLSSEAYLLRYHQLITAPVSRSGPPRNSNRT